VPIPSHVLEDLTYQHETIRDAIDVCLHEADALDAGGVAPDATIRAIAALRLLVQAHDAYEEKVLGPMLAELDLEISIVDELVTQHTVEHADLVAQLAPTTTQLLRESTNRLLAHMRVEERRFLAMRTAQLVRRPTGQVQAVRGHLPTTAPSRNG
jgi:hypothetical protein